MREKSEVLEKFRDMCALKLRERKAQFISKTTRNCYFNCRLRIKGNSLVGFCQNPEILSSLKSRVFVCNEDTVSQNCSTFKCRNTVESVEKDFYEIIRSPARCGKDYPKIAMMIWFLQDYDSRNRWCRFKHTLGSLVSSAYRMFCFRWW